MPFLNNNVYLLEQNTKYPALSHVMSVRVSLTSAGATTTFNVPTTFNNPAQLAIAGFAATGEPQQGRRLFVTELVVRDVAGNLSGAGATGGGTVQLIDTTLQPNVTVATVTSPANATQAPYVRQSVQTGTAAVGPQDTLSIVYTQPTGATATATSFTVDIFGFWQQGI